MSSTETKKENTKAKVKLTAAWEWFKSAAWLQVLLIVGLVVGVVVAIPYVVQGITDLVNRNNSHFYESREITFDDFQDMIDGHDANRADGAVGDGTFFPGTAPQNYDQLISEDLEGFVIMFVKANCDQCSTLQPYVEKWYNDYNDDFGGDLKFYTIDVSFVPDDSSASSTAEGSSNNYKNESISLEQQTMMLQIIGDVYLKQDETHQNSSVTEDAFNADLNSPSQSGTLPTPTFLLYTKSKDDDAYDMQHPTKAICGPIGDLDFSSQSDVNQQMLDIFDFVVYQKASE